MQTNTKLIKIVSAAGFAAMIAVNILANALPLGDISTGQISAMYPTLFTPPGFTFAIWGLIYGMLGLFLVIQLFGRTANDLADISPYLLLSYIFNIAWLITWHNRKIILATIFILLLLADLIKIYAITRSRGFITKTTFSIYYAWITVASIVSIFVLVKTLTGGAPVTPIEGRSALLPEGLLIIGGNPEIVSYVTTTEYVFAVIAALVIGPLTALHIVRFHDNAYAFIIIWAVGGILYKNLTAYTPPLYMLAAAFISVGIILAVLAGNALSEKKRKGKTCCEKYAN